MSLLELQVIIFLGVWTTIQAFFLLRKFLGIEYENESVRLRHESGDEVHKRTMQEIAMERERLQRERERLQREIATEKARTAILIAMRKFGETHGRLPADEDIGELVECGQDINLIFEVLDSLWDS